MSGDRSTEGLTRRTENSSRELLARAFFFGCAALSVVTTLSIVVLLVYEAAKFFTVTAPLVGVAGETATITEFLTGAEWGLQGPNLGVAPLVAVTVMVTLGSGLIAIPLGVATALYLSEYASPRARSYLKPALEVLAGVPSIIYGIFAVAYITPALSTFFPEIGFFNVASACVVVGIMILPMVASVSEDAMSAVPDDLRQAGYGMGATKYDVSVGVVVPAALSGIISSFILALSRAIGETMAVTLAGGSLAREFDPASIGSYLSLFDPESYLEPGMTMTAAMIQLLTGDITGGGLAYRSLFAVGLVLFIITLVMNILSDAIARRYKEAYE
ncbi:phosphate ABC transporter permease subunit PstC [Halolamina sp.]|jgi:phosphate transport system permease protein|uniref:phosphate ABC transporter permease subunit PstC n=1 Tax=Halolamina sp. TaxID=1940283 RepID=UPI000223B6DE|nr:phosphate ABC transporter, inner membrane subunit PstC [halophilic archaeon DL31]